MAVWRKYRKGNIFCISIKRFSTSMVTSHSTNTRWVARWSILHLAICKTFVEIWLPTRRLWVIYCSGYPKTHHQKSFCTIDPIMLSATVIYIMFHAIRQWQKHIGYTHCWFVSNTTVGNIYKFHIIIPYIIMWCGLEVSGVNYTA